MIDCTLVSAEVTPALLTLDPHSALAQELLGQRTATGRYQISDEAVAYLIRHHATHAALMKAQGFAKYLFERCKPTFRRMSTGLCRYPELREEAMADMSAVLWKELTTTNETFMFVNFCVYIRRVAADAFKHKLLEEGLMTRGEIGKPARVPAGLRVSLDQPTAHNDEQMMLSDLIPAATDDIACWLDIRGVDEMLRQLPKELDQQIMYLRVFEDLQWQEIGHRLEYSERAMRNHYAAACEQLRAILARDDQRDS